MPTKKMPVSQETYQIKVTLLGTRPPIWRRLLVPANLTLARLHDVLQISMGWQNCHLHEFRIGKKRFSVPAPDDAIMGTPAENERSARLSTVLGEVGAKAIYTYDFGDSWDHQLVVEKVLPIDSGKHFPVCVAGKLHGPPEDCGGLPGFYTLLEALSDPAHPERADLLEAIGDKFDPEAFSIEEVNQNLAPLQRLTK